MKPFMDVRRVNFVPISLALRPMAGVGHLGNLPAARTELNIEAAALQLMGKRNVVTVSGTIGLGVQLTGVTRPRTFASYGLLLRWQPDRSVFGYNQPRLGGFGTAQLSSQGGFRLSFGAELVMMPGMAFVAEISNDFILGGAPSASTTLSLGWRFGLFE